MIAPKGYVVRGMNESGGPFKCPCKTLGGAEHARVRYLHEFMCTDVAIFAVSADGTETKLPSYEEALQRSQDVASILTDGVPAIMRSSAPATREQIGAAACQMLKAIERALSVLRGSEAPLATLDIERRRLAAKGGA